MLENLIAISVSLTHLAEAACQLGGEAEVLRHVVQQHAPSCVRRHRNHLAALQENRLHRILKYPLSGLTPHTKSQQTRGLRTARLDHGANHTCNVCDGP